MQSSVQKFVNGPVLRTSVVF